MRATLAAVTNPTVLVADDDPLIVATVGHGLREAKFDVLEAFDSSSALAACIAHKPSLAVIDYAMPGYGGLELARFISTQTDVPLIFLSAYSDEAIVCEAIAAGALAYLVKPIDTQQLLAAVRTALQRGRELRALRLQANQLNTALQTGRTVNVATGLLMAKFQIGQQEAFECLRHYARSNRTRLEEAASELLRANDEAGKLYESLSRGIRAAPADPTHERNR